MFLLWFSFAFFLGMQNLFMVDGFVSKDLTLKILETYIQLRNHEKLTMPFWILFEIHHDAHASLSWDLFPQT